MLCLRSKMKISTLNSLFKYKDAVQVYKRYDVLLTT